MMVYGFNVAIKGLKTFKNMFVQFLLLMFCLSALASQIHLRLFVD